MEQFSEGILTEKVAKDYTSYVEGVESFEDIAAIYRRQFTLIDRVERDLLDTRQIDDRNLVVNPIYAATRQYLNKLEG